MNKLIEIIFPLYANYIANGKVRKRIDNLIKRQNSPDEDTTESVVDEVDIEVYREMYHDTFKIKDKLEDKAKTNVVGVTIAITLIMGASGVINTIYCLL
jgi:DNA/RNA-binding domain of Phe-tRNA-synthetase-like protein